MRYLLGLLTTALLAMIASSTVSAHHSVAALFDRNETIEISGELTRLFWRNPHVRMWVTDENGKEWELETSVIGFFERVGVTAEMFEVGSNIRVLANPARRSDDMAYALNVLLSDGREILMERGVEPVWSDQLVRGFGRSQIDAAAAAEAESRAEGIFRVWTNTRFQQWTATPTPAAEAARAAWNPETDDPRLRCIAPGMVDAMASPYPIEIAREGDDIIIRMEEWDGVRRINMSTAPDASTPPALMGYSVGLWEGNTLVVTTDRVDWPYFDNEGTPQSGDVQIVERFALSDDETSLEWEAVVTDPENLMEPAVVTQGYSWVPGEVIMEFDCAISD